MLPKPVLTKGDFVRRYKAGEFGNASITWNSVPEYLASDYKYPVHFRNRVANGLTWYNVEWQHAVPLYARILSEGVKSDDIYVSAMAPHHLNVIQGEVQRSNKHIDLFYSTAPDVPMRDALNQGAQQVHGATARLLLRFYLNQRSYEWLEWLLDSYPNHVVEFSVFQKCWGTIPGHNTVFWEVRKY